jgi:hypothetical protein
MTNDVENFSIQLNKLDYRTAKEVYEVGLPRLLEIYAKNNMISTFYFTGEMADMFPESVELVKEQGHEIGCHSYSHMQDKMLDVLSYEEQLNDIKKSKYLLESIAGKVDSFRAPYLRLNEHTIRALEQTEFLSDSSICSQRFDGPFTFFSKTKLKWLSAPRKPYFLSYKSITKKGDSNILEIPISALLFSFSGTVMRRSPLITKMLQKYLLFEANQIDKPLVFLFHPHECLEIRNEVTPWYPRNFFNCRLSDIRQRLYMKNFGEVSLKLLDNILKSAKVSGKLEFLTIKEYTKMYKRDTNGNH